MTLRTVGKIVAVASGIGTLYAWYKVHRIESNAEAAFKRSCKVTAENRMSDEDKTVLNDFDDSTDMVKNILSTEGAELERRMQEWKQNTGYSIDIDKTQHEYTMAVDTWKKEHCYDETKKGLADSRDSQIRDYISTSGCEEKIKDLMQKIASAKRKYENEKAVAKAVGNLDDNFSSGAKELKKSAKNAMEEAVKQYESEIKDIKKAKDDFVNSVNAEYTRSVAKIEKDLREATMEAKKDRDTVLDALRYTHDKQAEDFKDAIKAERSEEVKKIFYGHEDLKEKAKEITRDLINKEGDLYKAGTWDQKFACSAIEMGLDWVDMAILMSMPVILGAYAFGNHIYNAYRVVKQMRYGFRVVTE